LVFGKVKAWEMREFIMINDRLDAFLTPPEDKITIVNGLDIPKCWELV
jgi:hypothetical protein